MQAANGMRDMALVHQIVVDKDFKLRRAEPEPDSMQRIIKDTMHKAFWDVLRMELAETTPNYNQVRRKCKEIDFNFQSTRKIRMHLLCMYFDALILLNNYKRMTIVKFL